MNARHGRVDLNQKSIVKELRSRGCSVFVASDVGRNFPDLVIGHKGVNYMVELKSGKYKQSEGQVKFEKEWRGQYNVAYTIEELLEIIGE